MGNIRSFRELKVWQKAMDVAMQVFELTKKFPAEEKYSLTDQIRRSSRSVPANISEAWRKRPYPAAFVSKLNDSEGEVALRCKYLAPQDAASLDQACEEILAMLTDMASHPEQWTIPK